MTNRLVVPGHVKYRREDTGGLVYDHENYGYEDATLTHVSSPVLNVLEHVQDNASCGVAELEAEFSPEIISVLFDQGFLTHE